MHCEEIFSVSKVENGFILEARTKIKPKSEKGKGSMGEIYGGCCGEVKFVCKTVNELFSKIKEVLPKLDTEYTSTDDFDKAFKAATMEEEDD